MPTLKAYSLLHAYLYPGWSRLYEYTADLLCLDFCQPTGEHDTHLLNGVSTPLSVEEWSRALSGTRRSHATFVQASGMALELGSTAPPHSNRQPPICTQHENIPRSYQTISARNSLWAVCLVHSTAPQSFPRCTLTD